MAHRQPREWNDDCLWDRHKATIRRLYVAENKPLEGVDGVVQTMRDLTHNEFNKTPRQYETRLKKWGFRKNQRGEHWAIIGRKRAARKEGGKESIVYFQGKEVPQAKISKRIYCNSYEPTFQYHNQGSIPATPEGFALLTPVAENQEPILTFNLPFVQFQVVLRLKRSNPRLLGCTESHGDLQDSYATSCDVFHASLPGEPTAPKSAQEIEAHRAAANTYYTTVLPTMKSLLPSLAVEEYTGSGSGTLPPWEILHEAHLKLLCFSVANNFAGLPDFSRNLIWDFVRKQASVLELLHLAPGPTTKVLAEKFFTCAIETGDVQAVEYLLRKGDVDANGHVCIVEDVPYTPVELSARTQNIRTAKLLISYKADVNKTYGDGYFRKQGALQHAIEPCTRGSHVEPELVHILLDAGARVDSETVGTTIKKSYAQIAEIIIKRVARVNHDLWNKVGIFHAVFAYLDIGTATRIFQLILEVDANINISLNIFPLDSLDRLVWDPYADGKTLLDIAAQRGQIDLVTTVLRHGAFLTEDTLTCAIQSTNKDVISYVLHQGAKVNSLATFGETPYSEAVRAGYMDLVQLLEDKGALDEIEDRPRFKAAVCAASEVGNLGVLKHLVEKIADLNHDMHVELGYALVEAVMAGHEKVALFLIDADADVNVSARYGEHFALHGALQRKMKNLVRALLNVDVALYRMRDARLLQAAIEWGDHSIIKDLIFAGAGINDSIYSRFHGAYEVPLTMAIDRNDIELVQLLLAEGANINCSYAKDRSALTTAVNRGNIDMVHFLLEEGADPADTIALVEATSQSPSFVHLLLEAFAKRYPHSKRGYGSEAAVKAIEEDNFEMLEVLLKSNADFSTCWENRQGLCEAPLACAIMKNKLAMVQRLIDRGLDLNDIVAVGEARVLLPPPPPRQSSPPSPITRYRPTNPDSQPPLPPPSSNFDRPRLAIPPRFTALLVAVRINDPEMLQTLIDAGAKVNLAATRGIKRTPLQMAAELGKMTALQVLIKNGAAINAKPAEDAGGTALQLAAIGGFLGIAEELLKRGADVNALPSKRQGRTALEGAVEHGRIDMVRFLLNAGAEIGSPGHRQYERLLKLAEKKGHRVVLQMLESFPRSDENVKVQCMRPDNE